MSDIYVRHICDLPQSECRASVSLAVGSAPMSTERPGRIYAAPTPPLAFETNPPGQGAKAPPATRGFFNSPKTT